MRKESLSKEVFEVHIKYTQEQLLSLRDVCAKINATLDMHEKTLMRNTITVEEHHKRPTHIEEGQTEFLAALNDIVLKLTYLQTKVNDIEDEIQPIKSHTDQVSKMLKFLLFLDENKKGIAKAVTFFVMLMVGAYVGFSKSDVIVNVLEALK